jgi:hypothetical protein
MRRSFYDEIVGSPFENSYINFSFLFRQQNVFTAEIHKRTVKDDSGDPSWKEDGQYGRLNPEDDGWTRTNEQQHSGRSHIQAA